MKICITGIDGSGKSTLVSGLEKHFPTSYVADIWDLLKKPAHGLPFTSKQDIDSFLCELTPNSRLLFLAHAMRYAMDKALESQSNLIIYNAGFYKYLATEIALGALPDLGMQILESLPRADKVFRLNISVETAAQRKKRFSRYECGLCQQPNAVAFVKHQNRTLKNWALFDDTDWHELDAEKSPQTLVNEIIGKI